MKDGKSIGSISSVPSFNGFIPSKGGILVYFTTDVLAGDVEKAVRNGASHVTPKTKIQVEGWGYFAIIEDPVGNKSDCTEITEIYNLNNVEGSL